KRRSLAGILGSCQPRARKVRGPLESGALRTLYLSGSDLALSDVTAVAAREVRVRLSPAARGEIRASRRVVDRAVRRKELAYGLTTGFGRFADVPVSGEKLERLQKNLVRSHAAGVGRPLSDAAVRAMILLRANALARGLSGIRVETVETLLAML